jgi:lipid-A-disaccharide synthase
VRYFFSTGEASGELSAIALATAIRAFDANATFEGIGSARMREDGFSLWRDHAGWASMGPLAALPRIPKLLTVLWQTAWHVARSKPDLVVLVDFGAFNLRLAALLRRRFNYGLPILDWFPPGTWLDDERTARAVASRAVPLTAFEHQHDFYKRLQLPIAYFGHPLASRYVTRAPRPAPPSDGGHVAMLPGSRSGELRYHVPLLLEAYRLLKARRPGARLTLGAADASAVKTLRRAVERAGLADAAIVRGAQAAIDGADAAWVASGTAVLETALSGVPSIAFYVISKPLAWHARRIYSGKFITLPNLVLGREIVPEFLQKRATPQNLAAAMHDLLCDPQPQCAQFAELRRALGEPDALERSAAFAVALAQAGRA